MTRAACLFPVLVTAGLALTPMARAQTDSTASEIAALRRELGTLAARNQQQIDALQNQVRELSAELAKSRRGRAAGGRPVEPKPGAEAAATPPSAAAATHPAEPKPGAGPGAPATTVAPRPVFNCQTT